jgi:two-component system response regulator GlrR
MSKRAGALVTVNCAALPEPLAESELFGHVAGAFSGSKKQRGGLFVEAHRGTLFLDEIGDLALDLQPKLLRVLEEGSLRPVGADRPREVDVRVVAATNRILDAMVEAGHFRLDLLHRLGAQRVALPPLRERREDIPALVARACEAQSVGVDLLVMERWLLAPWPGNVRQLNNEVARLAIRARHEGLSSISLDLLERDTASAATPASAGVGERERLILALQRCRGNVAETARELGLQRTKLYDLLNRHSIDPREFRRGPRS